MSKRIIALLFFTICISLPSLVSAQVPKGSVRLSLDTAIVDFGVGSWNPKGTTKYDYTKLAFGIGNPNVAFGIGGTLANAFAVGARFKIGMDKNILGPDEDWEAGEDMEDQEVSVLRWGVLPYLEYAFLTHVVRPFIMVNLGFEGEVTDISDAKAKYWEFVFGAGGGLHFFASPTFSIDATLLLGFSAGSGEEDVVDTAGEIVTQEYTRAMFRLSTLLGVSGWF